MTGYSETERPEVRRFEAARVWQSRVYGAAVVAIGGALLFCVVAGIMIYMAPVRDVYLTAGALVGSVIIALLKIVYIPIEEIKGVRRSLLAVGWIVSLSRRHGLLKGFVIHGGFGRQSGELARAIENEIARRGV
jgi:hypothetical protein